VATIYKHFRSVVIGSLPEPDPNTVEPTQASVFKLDKRVRGGDKLTEGHSLFFEFLDAGGLAVSGPTVEWVTWVRDDESRKWANMAACSGAGLYELFLTYDAKNADLFVQCLAVTAPGTAVRMVVRVAEI